MQGISTSSSNIITNTPNKLYLCVSVLDTFDNRKLQKLVPDEYGYFTGIPLSAFNAKSLNGCYYDTESYYNILTTPTSTFNIKLRHGNLYGEWGHPREETDLVRITTIDKSRESHHFRSVYTDKNCTSQYPIIRGDLRPSGPYGEYLKSSLMNPYENTAFSLRCLMSEKFDRGLNANVRAIEEFVTFDAVDMPGYLYGSKWYVESTSTGKECLMPITIDMLYSPSGKRVALESMSDQRVLELFGVEDLKLNGEPLGNYVRGTNTYRDKTGVNRSITHAVLNRNYF